LSNDFFDAITYALEAMTMGKYIVFYGQQIYGEYDSHPWCAGLPDGGYLRSPKGVWYIVLSGGLTPINLSDIPPEVRLNCLLLGIQV
jgi:hypothetical protein